MPERPELPTVFASSRGAFSLMPDSRPMRWTLWDLDGCIGEISLDDGVWHSHPEPQGLGERTHTTWALAAGAIVAA